MHELLLQCVIIRLWVRWGSNCLLHIISFLGGYEQWTSTTLPMWIYIYNEKHPLLGKDLGFILFHEYHFCFFLITCCRIFSTRSCNTSFISFCNNHFFSPLSFWVSSKTIMTFFTFPRMKNNEENVCIKNCW